MKNIFWKIIINPFLLLLLWAWLLSFFLYLFLSLILMPQFSIASVNLMLDQNNSQLTMPIADIVFKLKKKKKENSTRHHFSAYIAWNGIVPVALIADTVKCISSNNMKRTLNGLLLIQLSLILVQM